MVRKNIYFSLYSSMEKENKSKIAFSHVRIHINYERIYVPNECVYAWYWDWAGHIRLFFCCLCPSGFFFPIFTPKVNYKIQLGAPGWLSGLSVRLRLRVGAPRRALCGQLGAWSLLGILRLPLSLTLPRLCSVSASVSQNKTKQNKNQH